MNFPIIMSLWLMRQGLDDDTDLEALASALSQFMITVYGSKESNKTEPDTLTFQAGAPIIISSEGAYSVIECSDGEIVISKVAD